MRPGNAGSGDPAYRVGYLVGTGAAAGKLVLHTGNPEHRP
jgi:hypothetical protein